MRLELVEPRLERQHRFAPQTEDAQARISRNALVGDEARLEQDPQVSAHDGSGRPGGFSQLAGATRTVTEKLDHPPPRRIGECEENTFYIVRHVHNN